MPNDVPKRPSIRKFVIATIILVVIGIVITLGYFEYSFSHVTPPTPKPNQTIPVPDIDTSIALHDLLFYKNGQAIIPYLLLNYRTTNVSTVYVNVSILKSAPPGRIYILNVDDECFNCGNTQAIISSMENKLIEYNLIKSPSDISVVQIQTLPTIANNSVLIILNGLLPNEMLNKLNTTNTTLVQYLMDKGTSIIYVGQDFTHVLLVGSIVVPTSPSSLPGFLSTFNIKSNPPSGFYFNKTTFRFSKGNFYGPVTYVSTSNGTVVAFSNVGNSWSSDQVGADIARSIKLLFWIPKLASGISILNLTTTNATDKFGLIMSIRPTNYSSSNIKQLNTGFGRIVIEANNTRSANGNNTAYRYIYFKPNYRINGTISIPPSLIPNGLGGVTMTIFVPANVSVPIQPHLSIYTLNYTNVLNIPLPFTSSNKNFTFLKFVNLYLPPGEYIATLRSFTNQEYASSYFNISKITISLSTADFKTGNFTLMVSSNGQPLSNIDYTITLNNLYGKNGTIQSGLLSYSLPKGAPPVSGNLSFRISMLSRNYTYETSYNPTVVKIQTRYIFIAIVFIVVILILLLVKAPTRDEFYIDVPNLPEQKKTNINLKAKDVISVFDKLNMYYHWRYMPLTRDEVRTAITSNIRYNNIPVGLTYSNVENILNTLTVKNYLASADNLYAPADWLSRSGHDIEYLATFKKLRIYLVTHGYVFTDLDSSELADIVASLRSEKKYVVIYSKTSKFVKKLPIHTDSKSYLVFLNSDKLDEFKRNLYDSPDSESEFLKMYISVGYVSLVSADKPGPIAD